MMSAVSTDQSREAALASLIAAIAEAAGDAPCAAAAAAMGLAWASSGGEAAPLAGEVSRLCDEAEALAVQRLGADGREVRARARSARRLMLERTLGAYSEAVRVRQQDWLMHH